jgi:hypothetical protein
MKSLIFVTLISGVLVGCDGSASTKTFPVMPPELSDCQFFKLTDENGARYVIGRCPNSTTSVNPDTKSKNRVIVNEQ